jgi:hypothetical protein
MQLRLLLPLLLLAIVGCSEPDYSHVTPYDAESARVINELGITHHKNHGLVTLVARADLQIEEIDGKVKARLTEEDTNPLTFKAGMSPEEAIKAAADAEKLDEKDPLVKRALEIVAEMEKTNAETKEGGDLKARLTAEFEKTPGLKEAVQKVINHKYQ